VHSDIDVNLAHEYALTRVNFREPAESKFVVRMAIDRHNCFGENCGVAANRMLEAVTAWRNRVADMIPAVPRGLPAAERVTEDQVLQVPLSGRPRACTNDCMVSGSGAAPSTWTFRGPPLPPPPPGPGGPGGPPPLGGAWAPAPAGGAGGPWAPAPSGAASSTKPITANRPRTHTGLKFFMPSFLAWRIIFAR
jgi:hypothetical protein